MCIRDSLVTHDREDCPPTGRCLAMERWQ
ncbi:hypothetical protein ACL650_13120, partial [Klebsiella pneumoniae]